MTERSGCERRVTVTSIGTATPGQAASIAIGLGVPVQRVMAALYRAPTILVDGLQPEIAHRMAELLRDVGCEACVEDEAAPPPAKEPLFDVALHITDTGRHSAITESLGTFLGIDAGGAARLIAQQPGVVLGQVSGATVAALRERLGDGADLLASDPDTATYDVFLGDGDAASRTRLLGQLRRRGHTPLAERGCLLTGLDRAAADAIWAAHHRVAALRVINRDFLRFDVVLTGGAPTPEALATLASVAGIPETVLPRLFEALPITVIEALPNEALAGTMTALAQANLEVRADLMTFLHLGVEVTSAPSRSRLARTLSVLGAEAEGLSARPLPIRLPYLMPELQARLLREALAAQGIEAMLFEAAEAA
ncbi:hypothetical protein [Roseitranquillus sediminis]|uniref:hypothetical protein n=1 Tax=Roseitranquillus sediminis TaxID=2809051 RepID=UPI001D0BFADD|nr:hypothetical protein [Roseitranquillus sediminis]